MHTDRHSGLHALGFACSATIQLVDGWRIGLHTCMAHTQLQCVVSYKLGHDHGHRDKEAPVDDE